MGIIATQVRRSDRFHFGFCNAIERSALHSFHAIRFNPTVDAVCADDNDRRWVTAGVLAALAIIQDGDTATALEAANAHGLSLGSWRRLLELCNAIRAEQDGAHDAEQDQDVFPPGA